MKVEKISSFMLEMRNNGSSGLSSRGFKVNNIKCQHDKSLKTIFEKGEILLQEPTGDKCKINWQQLI